MAFTFTARAVGAETYEDDECFMTYGGVREAVLKDRVLRIVVDPSNLEALGLNDSEIEVALDVEETHIHRLREGLRRVLTYGRPSEQPAVLDL